MKNNIVLALGFMALGLLSGCGGGGNDAVTTVPTAHLAVTPAASSAVAGDSFSVTVTALDPSGAVVSTYAGTVHITTSDARATLPADATLAAGAGTFTVFFGTAGIQTITATDTVGNATAGTSKTVAVSATQTIAITPSIAFLPAGGAQSFVATNFPQGGQWDYGDGGVTWSVTEGTTGGSITADGVYTAPSVPGTYHVVANSVDPPSATGQAEVTVLAGTVVSTLTGSMHSPRGAYTATLLANGPAGTNGKVLMAGGNGAPPPVVAGSIRGISAAELYDPSTGTFAATGSMTTPRYAHTATLLPNGKVLVVGGLGDGYKDQVQNPPPVLSSAELYDPATGTFTPTGSMHVPRTNHTATLVSGNRVLIVGGISDIKGGGPATVLNNGRYPYSGQGLNTAEVYDIVTGTFTATHNPKTARYGHTATLLANGTVLIAGGVTSSDGIDGGVQNLTADIYDVDVGFTPTGSMQAPRDLHAATLLNDGRVLFTGGFSETAEIYDPKTGTFSATGTMGAMRSAHTATMLPNGTVLLAGGASTPQCIDFSAICGAMALLEIFDPSTGKFAPLGFMNSARSAHTATLLNSGGVLLSGGEGENTAELYQ